MLPHGSERVPRAKGSKTSQFTLSHQSNYIDAEPPPDVDIYGRHREPRVRRREADHFPHHEHYVYLYIGGDQKWHARASPCFHDVRKDVLTQSLPLLKGGISAAGTRDEDDEPPPEYQPQAKTIVEERPRQSAISYPFNAKRRRMNSESVEPRNQEGEGSRSSGGAVVARQHRPSKSSKGKGRNDVNMVSLDPTNRDQVTEWFTNAFKAIQQTACRSIAKEWIKTVHPKKQSTHPYNGNMPRSGHRSPERTRPPYWPHDVRHKEPDHIDKTARTKLLVHLIQNTPQPEVVPDPTSSEKLFYARDLLAVLEQKQDESVMPKMDIVREIIEVRELMEKFEEGGIDPGSGFYVTDYGQLIGGSNTKKKKKNRTNDSCKSDNEGDDADQDDDNTPALTPNVSISEDNTLESVPLNDLVPMDVNTSFYSTSSEQDVKPEIAPPECRDPQQQHAGSQQQSYAYNMPYNRNVPVSMPMPMHGDQHSQAIPFLPHHGMSHDASYNHPGWSMAPPPPGVDMNNSFDENVLSYQTPVPAALSQPPYGEPMVLRLRNDHSMVPQPRFSGTQFLYPTDDSIARTYHIPNAIQHDYDNSGMFYSR